MSLTVRRGQVSLNGWQALPRTCLLYSFERLAAIPGEGKHASVALVGYLTWSNMMVSEEKSQLGEMTAKQWSMFKWTASSEEYSDLSVIHYLFGMAWSRICSGPDSSV